MPENLSSQLTEEAYSHTVDLMRVAQGLRNDVVSYLQALESELAGQVTSVAGRTGLNATRLQVLLRQTKETIASQFGRINRSQVSSLGQVARASGESVIHAINSKIEVPLLSVAFTKGQLETLASKTYFMGGVSKEWWGRQSLDLQQRFLTQMRLGLLQGEDVGDLVRRVRGRRENGFKDGLMQIPTYQAEALVRTSVVAVGNAGKLQAFMDNKAVVKGIQWLATLDNRTTDICIGLDGKRWSLPESGDVNDYGGYEPIGHDKVFPGPTAHWNCRSTQISILKSFTELAGPKANHDAIFNAEMKKVSDRTRASMDGQVAKSAGFEGWLNTKGDTFQDDLLGKQAGELWREGKLKLSDLTDQRNRPLTAAQLIAKVGGRPGFIVPPKALPPLLLSEQTQTWQREIIARHKAAWEADRLQKLADEAQRLADEAAKQAAIANKAVVSVLRVPTKQLKSVTPRDKMVQKISTAKVQSIVKNADGGINGSYEVALMDNKGKFHKGIFKPENEESSVFSTVKGVKLHVRERVASEFDAILGLNMVPHTLQLDLPGYGVGSWQAFAENAITAYRVPGPRNYDYTPTAAFDGDHNLGMASAFDFLIGSSDRHANNWMLFNKKNLVLIDNGYSFPSDIRSFKSQPYKEVIRLDLEIPAEVKAWANKKDELLQVMQANGFSQAEIDGVESRLELLLNARSFSDLKVISRR